MYVHSLYDFFRRYLQLRGPWAWCFGAFATAVCVSGILVRYTTRFHQILIVCALSFYIGLLFIIVEFNPIKIGIPYRDRYFVAGLPVLFIALASFLDITLPEKRSLEVESMVLFDLRKIHVFIRSHITSVYRQLSKCLIFVDRYKGALLVLSVVGISVFSALSVTEIYRGQHGISNIGHNLSVFENHFFNGTPITGPRENGFGCAKLVLG